LGHYQDEVEIAAIAKSERDCTLAASMFGVTIREHYLYAQSETNACGEGQDQRANAQPELSIQKNLAPRQTASLGQRAAVAATATFAPMPFPAFDVGNDYRLLLVRHRSEKTKSSSGVLHKGKLEKIEKIRHAFFVVLERKILGPKVAIHGKKVASHGGQVAIHGMAMAI
jgi:hypothetical protein